MDKPRGHSYSATLQPGAHPGSSIGSPGHRCVSDATCASAKPGPEHDARPFGRQARHRLRRLRALHGRPGTSGSSRGRGAAPTWNTAALQCAGRCREHRLQRHTARSRRGAAAGAGSLRRRSLSLCRGLGRHPRDAGAQQARPRRRRGAAQRLAALWARPAIRCWPSPPANGATSTALAQRARAAKPACCSASRVSASRRWSRSSRRRRRRSRPANWSAARKAGIPPHAQQLYDLPGGGRLIDSPGSPGFRAGDPVAGTRQPGVRRGGPACPPAAASRTAAI